MSKHWEQLSTDDKRLAWAIMQVADDKGNFNTSDVLAKAKMNEWQAAIHYGNLSLYVQRSHDGSTGHINSGLMGAFAAQYAEILGKENEQKQAETQRENKRLLEKERDRRRDKKEKWALFAANASLTIILFFVGYFLHTINSASNIFPSSTQPSGH